MTDSSRRAVLLGLGAAGMSALSGCFSESANDEPSEETDEIDEYRPTESTEATEQIGAPNKLDDRARQVTIDAKTAAFADPDVGYPSVRSYIEQYSFDQIDVALRSDGDLLQELNPDQEYTVQALARRFPDGITVGTGHSEFFTPGDSSSETVTVEMEYRENVVSDQVSVMLGYSQDISSDDDGGLQSQMLGFRQLFASTDPFTVTKRGIERYKTEHDRPSAEISYQELTTEDYHPERGQYTVQNTEGGYFVFFETQTPDRLPPILFRIPFYVPKETFAKWKAIERPNYPEPPADRTSYVTDSREDGIGEFVGSMLDSMASLQGATSDAARIEFISTFVQSLPYALDRISTGYTDYSRLPAETLVDAKGDCVDTTILLCVALLESAVSCDVAFFSYGPSATSTDAGHLAVGISPDNVTFSGEPYVESRGQRYYYIEPTGFFRLAHVPGDIDFRQTEIHPIE